MIDLLWNALSFVVAIGILVFFHEYGHFWVARKNGVKVIRFAIGFGKPLHSWKDKLGTEYVIGAIPLGGYVRMLDGRIDEVSAEEENYSFNHKSVKQRIAIVAAGPIANFMLAVVFLFVMFIAGVPAIKPVIGDVTENSPAHSAGINPFDEIISVDGQKVVDVETAYYALIQQVGSDTINIDVRRENNIKSISLNASDWRIEENKVFEGLGFSFFRPKPLLSLAHIVENSAAQRAGLVKGDTIIAINNVEMESWRQAATIFRNSPEIVIELKIEREGQQLDISLKPENKPTKDGFSQGFVGVAPGVEKWPEGYVFSHQYGIFPAALKSVEQTWLMIKLSFQMIGKLISGDIGIENLSGPISIAEGAGVSAQSGLINFIKFLALISVNLGVVNLLPLPVLDGGHLMYFFIELIRGKPVSERVQNVGFRIGAFLLMMIMGVAIFNDLGRL